MKKSDIKQLATKSKEELSQLIRQQKAELTKLVLEKNTSKSKNTMMVGQKKKQIARILTFLQQKEMNL